QADAKPPLGMRVVKNVHPSRKIHGDLMIEDRPRLIPEIKMLCRRIDGDPFPASADQFNLIVAKMAGGHTPFDQIEPAIVNGRKAFDGLQIDPGVRLYPPGGFAVE